jgi:4-phospho-D-threonate 3-dehydrogenase / 4-phospho-D-erythronate 3-dehydrogenase
MNNKLIAVTIGDITGVGIKIIIKEWKRKKINNFIIITNFKIFIKFNKNEINKNQINVIDTLENYIAYKKEKLNIFNIEAKDIDENTLESLKIAYKYTKQKKFIGILTLPINKKRINSFADNKFIDQTSFFSNLENEKKSNMVFIYKKMFFVPLTTHIEIKQVHEYFKNKENIFNKIDSLNNTLKRDFNIYNSKYILAGINPHSGEMGLISNDDDEYLKPVIKKLRKRKIDIIGPVSGDSIINKNNLKKYNVFLFTFHDQALIPFKMISNFKGVNYTSGLDIIRVSPSHGTGKDLIKNNSYNSVGVLNCFKIIKEISKNRVKFD